MGYWADSFATEKLQLVLNAKAIVIGRAVDGRYRAVREVLPPGVGASDRDQFSIVRLEGAHYELMGDSPRKTSFPYDQIPACVRVIPPMGGFYAAIPKITRRAQLVGDETMESMTSRREMPDEVNSMHLDARNQPSRKPGRRYAGRMATLCEPCGARRWIGEVARATICRIAVLAQIAKIQDPPDLCMRPLKALAKSHLIS